MSDTGGARQLDGKVALVMGGGAGLGQHIALALAREGADVAVATVDGADPARPSVVSPGADEAEVAGATAFAVSCDVQDEGSVTETVEVVLGELGHLDVVVCNLGTPWHATTLDTPVERWREVVATTLDGVFIVTRATLPHLLRRPAGSLIALTTPAVHQPALGSNAYWVAKAAVERYYLGLAHELADHNIAVNCLAPKEVRPAPSGTTDHAEELGEDPDAVARSAVFLASQDASGETGRVVYSLDLLEELARR